MAVIAVVIAVAIAAMLAAMVVATHAQGHWAPRIVWLVVGLLVVACAVVAVEMVANPSFYRAVFPYGG